MTLDIRQITQPELWFDTSETLTLAQYQLLAGQGFRGGFRYLPLAGQAGGIQLAELEEALSVKCPDGSPFSLMFVQFSRSSNINGPQGTLDGQAAAAALQKLGIPPEVFAAQDLSPGPGVSACVAYSNASYAAMIAAGIAETAPGAYMEPGYPLTASQRYQLLSVQRYWAPAANDPQKMVSSRGCQVIQLWGSSRGEYSPAPGIEIDADAVQSDYFGGFPVAVIAA